MQNQSTVPPLFQITEHPEDFPPDSILESAPPLSRTPFADLMLHPEKLEAALNTAKSENDIFAATYTAGRSPTNGATSTASPKSNGERKFSPQPQPELKKTEFFLEAPSAVSVKLAAEFTEWEKFPLDMMKYDDGVWCIFVPLPPGSYCYRFIVDGKWCDDPHANQHEPNPFGTTNAVVEVN